ncbi:reverse transcriptase domain-containing protein [Tanacetum coccineum]
MTSPTRGGDPEGQDDREGTPPLTKEQIEGHISAMKSIIKEHNKRNKANPIRLNFETEDPDPKEDRIVKGREIDDEDLSKPFKETLKTPSQGGCVVKINRSSLVQSTVCQPTSHWDAFESLPPNSIDEWWRLREAFTTRYSTRKACYKEPHEITKIVRRANETLTAFKERWTVETGFIMGVPEVMKISSFMDSVKSPELAKRFASSVPKTVDEMMRRLDEDDRDGRNSAGKDFRKSDYRNSYKGRDNFNTGRHRDYGAPYHQRERTNRPVPVLSLDSLTKCPKEILATETQLQLPPPRPVANPLRTGDPDKYCDYHQDKGHHTNDCIQLRKQLEIALESGKLNHLMKDLRQRVERSKKKTLRCRDDASDEPLIIEAEVEGYLVRRVYVDEGSSVEVMFEHCFENLPEKVKAGLRETRTDLVGFAGEVSKPLGKIELEFPTPKGIATLIARTITIAECRKREEKQMVKEETPQEEGGMDVTEQIIVNPSFPDQMVTIGGKTPPGAVIEHALNVNPSLDPVCQKRRTFSPEKSGAVTKEVTEWVKAGIVRPVKYPTYISNPVLVKKCDGSWRMCIDFKNLNSACPKDYYPLPNIDCKVEAVMGLGTRRFLDAYKVIIKSKWQRRTNDKTSFLHGEGNVLIGRNLEAYVDDMVIKSKEETGLLTDIAETFEGLKTINMKLNPKKCSFGVEEGKFLGYMVTSEGIRANPKKTKAISDLQSPKTLKEMQSLSGKLASLNRFLAKSAERALPFFNTLKNITKENRHEFRWTTEAEEAFQQMKKYLYRNGRQCPVQYVSRTLNEAERNYSPLEKLALSLVNMTRRLRRYFEAHPVKVITDQPIRNILSRTEVSGKLAKYAVEIGTYKISFIPRNAVKGQVLADFLSDAPDGEREDEYFQSPEVPPEIDDTETWTLYTDGAASSKGSGAGLILTGPSGVEYAYALRLTFASTNNEAEYEALLAGLRIARMMNVPQIEVKVDSKLVDQ